MGDVLFIGGAAVVVCVAVQCTTLAALLRVLLALELKQRIRTTLAGVTLVLSGTMLAMLLGNLVQIGVWAALFMACGEFSRFETAYYHSMVNFSTLGYGDIVMSERYRLLGSLEAANGVLMFGLTTSFLYAILHELLERVWERRMGEQTGDRA